MGILLMMLALSMIPMQTYAKELSSEDVGGVEEDEQIADNLETADESGAINPDECVVRGNNVDVFSSMGIELSLVLVLVVLVIGFIVAICLTLRKQEE